MLKLFIENCFEAINVLGDEEAGKLLKIMAADAMELDPGPVDSSLLPIWLIIRTDMRRAGDYSQKQREDSLSRLIPANPSSSHSPSPSPSPSQSKKKEKQPVCVFVPPSLDDVLKYAAEKHPGFDGRTFYDYFTAGGWVDSRGNKVRNWKQKMITWVTKERANDPDEKYNREFDQAYFNLTGKHRREEK